MNEISFAPMGSIKFSIKNMNGFIDSNEIADSHCE